MADSVRRSHSEKGGLLKIAKKRPQSKMRQSMQSQGGGSRAQSRAGGGGGFGGRASRWSHEDEDNAYRPHVYMPGDEWQSHHSREKKAGVYYQPRNVVEIDIHYDKIKWPLYDDFIFQRRKNCPHLPNHIKKVKMMLGLNKG